MDKFQKSFLQEAEELIANLEKALLSFEQDLENEQSVKEIFRIMHTLKGGGSMFGFDSISSTTHHLETIYDQIRNNKIKASKEILDVTFIALDHLKRTLNDQFLNDPKNKSNHEKITKSIEAILEKTDDSAPETTTTTEEKEEIKTFYVLIEPHSSIFKNGTNPLFLVDDVAALGEAAVAASGSEIPEFSALQPDECYTSFEIILATEKPISEINDVFIFAEDQCHITIQQLAIGNLLEIENFKDTIESKPFESPIFGLEIIETLAKTHTEEAETKETITSSEKGKSENSIRVASSKLDELMNLVSELVTTQAQITLIAEKNENPELTSLAESMEKITRRLRDNTFSICLVPIEIIVTRFQRLVRDLASELEKEVTFVALGTETELDKSLIENLSDPILHIIRNSIDHGIESPKDRLKAGKPAHGTIELNAYHSGTHVYIQIKDDGKGIDPKKIKRKAFEKGLISRASDFNEDKALELIFLPGFSTAETITDVSGRGVGMDVVKRKIEAIKGEVFITSKKGEGTTITIKLPLTLSIMDGMLVKIADTDYLIPLNHVDKCFEIYTDKLSDEVSQKHVFDGKLTPVFNLRSAFHEQPHTGEVTQVIQIKYDEFPVCITVDTIIGEYQAVMKPLGELYQNQDEFSGATILGDGSVALVLDTNKFIKQLIQKEEEAQL